MTVTISATDGLSLYVGHAAVAAFPMLMWTPAFVSSSTLIWGVDTELLQTTACTLIFWDVQLYDYVLTQQQVASLAQGGAC